MIQFMANTFQPITFLRKGWSSLPYPHTASKLISRDGPSAHLLLASCHLHPAIPHPAPAPKERQAQGLLNRSLSQQDSQERTRTHNLTGPDNSQCKSQQKNQHQDRWTRYIHQPLNHSLGWTVRVTCSTVTKHSQQQGQEHTLYCVLWHCIGKVPWGSPEQDLWISSQANTQHGIRDCCRNAPVTVFFSQLSRCVLSWAFI